MKTAYQILDEAIGFATLEIKDNDYENVIEAMEVHASQFKQPANNEAVKMIEERIKELELLYLKTDLEFYEGDKACYEARIEAKIQEANYLLKLIQ